MPPMRYWVWCPATSPRIGSDDAIAYLRQRVQTKPTDAVTYQLMAQLLERADKPQDAVAAYREVIRLQPTWLSSYRKLGALLVRSGDTAGAVQLYEDGYKAAPHGVELLARPGLGARHGRPN